MSINFGDAKSMNISNHGDDGQFNDIEDWSEIPLTEPEPVIDAEAIKLRIAIRNAELREMQAKMMARGIRATVSDNFIASYQSLGQSINTGQGMSYRYPPTRSNYKRVDDGWEYQMPKMEGGRSLMEFAKLVWKHLFKKEETNAADRHSEGDGRDNKAGTPAGADRAEGSPVQGGGDKPAIPTEQAGDKGGGDRNEAGGAVKRDSGASDVHIEP